MALLFSFNAFALRTAKTLWSFGHSECKKFKSRLLLEWTSFGNDSHSKKQKTNTDNWMRFSLFSFLQPQFFISYEKLPLHMTFKLFNFVKIWENHMAGYPCTLKNYVINNKLEVSKKKTIGEILVHTSVLSDIR